MFQVNGANGVYDSKVTDPSVRYGRNAVENHIQYMEKPVMEAMFKPYPAPVLDFSPTEKALDRNEEMLEDFINGNDKYLASLPPLEYEYRYVPKAESGIIDKKAVLGAAYEEMNGVKELSVEDFSARYLMNDEMTAEPLDVNKDGKIDIAEYGANIIATDLLSKDTTDVTKADGVINSKGMNAIVEYTKKANAQAASQLYLNIYNTYNLGNVLDELEIE